MLLKCIMHSLSQPLHNDNVMPRSTIEAKASMLIRSLFELATRAASLLVSI